MGYRNDKTDGVAKGNNAETTYMVTSGSANHVNGGCCFDCTWSSCLCLTFYSYSAAQ